MKIKLATLLTPYPFKILYRYMNKRLNIVIDIISIRRKVPMGRKAVLFLERVTQVFLSGALVVAITVLPIVSARASQGEENSAEQVKTEAPVDENQDVQGGEGSPAGDNGKAFNENQNTEISEQGFAMNNGLPEEIIEAAEQRETESGSIEIIEILDQPVSDTPAISDTSVDEPPSENSDDETGISSEDAGVSGDTNNSAQSAPKKIGNIVIEEITEEAPEKTAEQSSSETIIVEAPENISTPDVAIFAGNNPQSLSPSPTPNLEEIRTQIRSELEQNLRSTIEAQLESKIESQLRDTVEEKLRGELVSELRKNFEQEFNSRLQSELNSLLEQRLAEERDVLRKAIEKELKPVYGPTNLQQEYGFADNECTLLGEGELYCYNGTRDRKLRSSAEEYNDVIAKPDKEGDLEIYLMRGEKEIQITKNNTDDAAPVRDKDSELIVWQGMVNERWQIFVYDEIAGRTSQVTSGNSNNISPQVSDGYIVWQAWEDNSWNIFLAYRSGSAIVSRLSSAEQSGFRDSSAWITQRIASNPWHEVEPLVASGFVVWRAYIDNSWQVLVYEIASGSTTQVSEGIGEHKNPRLAILWDAKENGQLHTVQYNLFTEKVSVLETKEEKHLPVSQTTKTPAQENKAAIPVSSSSSANGGASGGGSSAGKNESDGE